MRKGIWIVVAIIAGVVIGYFTPFAEYDRAKMPPKKAPRHQSVSGPQQMV
jgi:hypothetical protein